MSKRKFYALCQYVDKTDGLVKCGYVFKEGVNVPNDYGIDLAAYNTKVHNDEGTKKIWYVVDVVSGLGIGSGDTKKKACTSAFECLANTSVSEIGLARRNVCEQYGEMPGKKIVFLRARNEV